MHAVIEVELQNLLYSLNLYFLLKMLSQEAKLISKLTIFTYKNFLFTLFNILKYFQLLYTYTNTIFFKN